jgi:hypothetical protein
MTTPKAIQARRDCGCTTCYSGMECKIMLAEKKRCEALEEERDDLCERIFEQRASHWRNEAENRAKELAAVRKAARALLDATWDGSEFTDRMEALEALL